MGDHRNRRWRGRSGDRGRAAIVTTIMLGIVVALSTLAFAAEVETTEVDGDVNDVVVEQGGTTTFTVRVRAAGALRCSATSDNPATVRIPTTYSIDATGAVTSGALGAPLPYFAVGTGTCATTWPGDPVPQTTVASVSADVFAPLGERVIRFRPTLNTPAGTGTPLRDDMPTFLRFRIVPGRDSVAPTVSCDGPNGAHGANGWRVEPVTYDCTAQDDGTGLAEATDAAFTLATDSEGHDNTDARTVVDRAGNGVTAGPFGPFAVDLHDPMVSVSWPADGEQIVLGAAAAVEATCSDTPDGSGVSACEIGAMDTSSVGARTVTVTASDHAGRRTSVVRSYAVVYGGTQPSVQGDHTRVQPGSTLVVRWSLGGVGDTGTVIGARSADCTTPDDSQTITTVGGPVRYNAATDRFQMNWKTDKGWTGCRQLQVALDDGTVRTMTVTFG